jgi:acetyltransferase-like isoleucine patch superfamily enzyme
MTKLTRFLSLPWHDRINILHAGWARLKTVAYYSRVMGSMGPACTIYTPLLLSNPRFIHMGRNILIRPGARMEIVLLNEQSQPSLVIGNNVNIEQNVHIICSSKIVIGDSVSITGNCAIVDTRHPFGDANDTSKIGSRIDPVPTPVTIGENTFMGFGSIILPGITIGRNCVIGANSTVTKDVPDYCAVAGNPARVVKSYGD